MSVFFLTEYEFSYLSIHKKTRHRVISYFLVAWLGYHIFEKISGRTYHVTLADSRFSFKDLLKCSKNPELALICSDDKVRQSSRCAFHFFVSDIFIK